MSIRRNIRLRREYIYRKSLETKERSRYERKRKIQKALDEGKPIPTELRNEEDELRKEIEADDSKTGAGVHSHIDDEYAWAGVRDPKVLITTSRDPSSKLLKFAKEMKLIFPNSQRVNRGGMVIKEIVDACRANDFTDVVIFQEHRGDPDGMIVSHLPYGPTCYFGISNAVLRHDIPRKEIGTMSEAYPRLIMHNFSTTLGERFSNILKYLFPVPKDTSRRVITFANEDDYISFRHHTWIKEGHKDVTLTEVGPRFELKPYQIVLGTIDMSDAQIEWVLRPYMNTAKRRKVL